MRLPKGYPNPSVPGHTKIAVSLSTSLFKQLRKRAEDEDKSFSALVEDVLKCGLLCLDESDAEEPRNVGNRQPRHTGL